MNEQLVSFETAKLAKEKGFREYTAVGYSVIGTIYKHQGGQESVITGEAYYEGRDYNRPEFLCSAPTQSLLQKWLREIYSIHIEIYSNASGWGWILTKINGTTIKEITDNFFYNTYEETLEIGLQEALKLI